MKKFIYLFIFIIFNFLSERDKLYSFDYEKTDKEISLSFNFNYIKYKLENETVSSVSPELSASYDYYFGNTGIGFRTYVYYSFIGQNITLINFDPNIVFKYEYEDLLPFIELFAGFTSLAGEDSHYGFNGGINMGVKYKITPYIAIAISENFTYNYIKDGYFANNFINLMPSVYFLF
jgi:hypothetical protein